MTEAADIHSWGGGAIGPTSADEPLFYELRVDDRTVRLVGPSPGQHREFGIDEFKELVAQGDWMLAEPGSESGVYHTPDGEYHAELL